MSQVDIQLTHDGRRTRGTIKVNGVEIPGVFSVTLIGNAADLPPILRLELRPREVVVTGEALVNPLDVRSIEGPGFIEQPPFTSEEARGHG